jgi:SAM-dependent methyltransferase
MSNAIQTAYTHAFVLASLPAGARRILEIGCGDGALAEILMSDGFDVLALDSDAACVAAAKKRGVEARHAEWPTAVEGTFDAILFTRSLHHVHDLDGAVLSSRRVLAAGGRVIVEDFRAEGGGKRAADWYKAMVRQLSAGGALTADASVAQLLDKLPPAAHDGHELHGSSAIRDALQRLFEIREEDAAYYFRYLEPHLREEGAAKWLLEVELEQIVAGEIDALGKRFVGTAK